MGEAVDGREPEGIKMVCPCCNGMFGSDAAVCPEDGSGLLEVPDAPLLTGLVLDGRYEVGNVVGSGGMGVVYRAHQRAMEREVAIKVLHPQYAHDPRAVKRFFREAQAASRLIHPNIVTVYDFGRSREGHLYMVMELLEGWTLGDLIFHRAPLSPETAVTLALQICSALEAAHQRRIVHRDLKPDNVQLVSRDGCIWAKVLDFGIARIMRPDDGGLGLNLSTVDIAGTPAYMSPEQIMGKDPDPRSDLYSLGVILFEMLTGDRPFEDENSVTLCMKQLNEEPPLVSAVLDDSTVPTDIESLVAALLSKSEDARPASTVAVREALEATGIGAAQRGADWDAPMMVATRSLPTRPDAGAMMGMPTLRGAGSAAASLAAVIDGVRSAPPEPMFKRPERGGSKPPAVVITLLSARASDLGDGPVAEWLTARQREGWAVDVRDATAALTVPRTDGVEGNQTTRLVLERLTRLRDAARRENMAVRAGFLEADTRESQVLADVARRLAAAAPHGEIAAPTTLARALEVRARPLTSVFLPSGKALGCCAIGELRSSRSVAADDVELVGRNRELRRLGQLADDARGDGPVAATVVGDGGVGKTSLVQAFGSGRAHLYLRVSPVAASWPGHTAARIAHACLGLPEASARAAVNARLDTLPLALRDRLTLLLLDEVTDAGVTASALAAALVELLGWRAGDGAFTLIVDDAHHLDPASCALLALLPEAAAGRPWLLLAVQRGDVAAEDVFPASSRVDVRPLGLRACRGILAEMGVAPNRQASIASAAGGNPLALSLLARAGGARKAPASAEAIILGLLPGHLRGVAPEEADRAWLGAVTGEPEVVDDLPARAARLYLEHGVPDALRGWLRRRCAGRPGLHARLAVAFSRAGANRADHAARAERLGLWHAAAAHALAAAQQEPEASASLNLDAARLLARAGDVPAAIERFEAALRGTTSSLSPDSLVALGAALFDVGEVDRAETVLLRARAAISAGGSARVFAELAAHLARCAVKRRELGDAMAHLGRAREAVDLLRPVDARGARGLEALVQIVRADVALAEGDAEATRTNLRQARDAYRDLGRPADAIRCLNDLAVVELDSGEVTRATDTFRAAVGLARAAGLAGELRRARTGLGTGLVREGKLDEGTQILRRVLREAGGRVRDTRAVADAAIGLAAASLARGLGTDAERYAARASGEKAPAVSRVRALALLAEVRIADGQLRQAARDLQDAHALATVAQHGLLRASTEERLFDLEIETGVELSRISRVPGPRTSPSL